MASVRPIAALYNAEISAGSLMLPESRHIARLLLQHPTEVEWDLAIRSTNLLQKKPATARRQARLIRNRLSTLDDDGLKLVADGDGELSSQVLLAAAARHSLLLSDFLRDVYGSDLRRLERTLPVRLVKPEDTKASLEHPTDSVKSGEAVANEVKKPKK